MIPFQSEMTTHILSADGCDDLPVIKLEREGRAPILASVWVPSEKEKSLIAQDYPIYLLIFGDTHPPVFISSDKEALAAAYAEAL
jgi:hypothetical protein